MMPSGGLKYSSGTPGNYEEGQHLGNRASVAHKPWALGRTSVGYVPEYQGEDICSGI